MGDKDHITRHKEKYNTLAEKAREIGYKVGMSFEGQTEVHSSFDMPCASYSY